MAQGFFGNSRDSAMPQDEISRILQAYRDVGVCASRDMFSDRISVHIEDEHQIDRVVEIGHVQYISFPGYSWVADALPKAFLISGLESLSVGARMIRGSSFEGVCQLPRLKELLVGSLLLDADDAMKHISKCQALESLKFHESLVSPDGYALLSGLTTLKELTFHRCILGELGWEQIGKIVSLAKLTVTFEELPYSPLESISGLSKLEELSLYFSISHGDPGFSSLAGLPLLRKLDLRGTYTSDDRVPSLGKLKQLRTLDITQTSISRDGLKRLRKLLPECEMTYSPKPIPEDEKYYPPLNRSRSSK